MGKKAMDFRWKEKFKRNKKKKEKKIKKKKRKEENKNALGKRKNRENM